MMTRKHRRCFYLGLAMTLLVPGRLAADARDDEIKALRELVNSLDQRLRALEQEREAERVAAAKPAPTPAAKTGSDFRVVANDRGFALASGDDANVIRLHGLMQADYRRYLNGGHSANDTFLIRRGRIMLDGRFNRLVEFQVTPEFAGSAATLLDANANLVLSPAVQVRVGRFKAPIGLEQMQSDSCALFVERAFPSQLTTSRDLGVLVSGDLAGGRANYAAGIFNGVGDGGSAATTDGDEHKDWLARVILQPFKNQADSPLAGLGFGLGASTGTQSGATGITGGYRTDGQQTIFRFRSGVVADGRIDRLSPQAFWYDGPIGVFGEFVQSRAGVRLTATGETATLSQRAWQLAGGCVLTGENASYRGVVPRSDFAPADGTWGACEVTARFSRLDLDDDTFPRFADPAASVVGATSVGVGINWYLTKTLRATLDYFHTDFDRAPATPATLTNPAIRQDEDALISRVQVSF